MPRPHHGCFRQPHPKLRVPSASCPGFFVFLKASVVGHQSEAVIRNRVHADVGLLFSPLAWPQTQGLAGLIGFLRHECEELSDLLLAHTLMEADRAQVVPAQPARELPQERVASVGRHSLDHELVPGGTERQRAPFPQ